MRRVEYDRVITACDHVQRLVDEVIPTDAVAEFYLAHTLGPSRLEVDITEDGNVYRTMFGLGNLVEWNDAGDDAKFREFVLANLPPEVRKGKEATPPNKTRRER